jgi:uncharacterized protein YbjT (DUF2867 family)
MAQNNATNFVDKVKALPVFNTSTGRILVTDSSGVVGYRIASKLLAAGYPTVRVGVRDSEVPSVAGLVSQGAEIKEFCWEKEYCYAQALEDVQSVYISAPVVSTDERFTAFIAACKNSNVKHIVKLSFYHALKSKAEGMMAHFGMAHDDRDPFADVHIVQMHGFCDMRVIKSRIDYTILFASHLMSNPLRYQAKNLNSEEPKFYGASHGKGVNYVSPNDVAEVAVRALLAPKDHSRTGYTLTGPKAYTDRLVAELIGGQLNKKVTYVEGLPHDADEDTVALEKIKASGTEEFVGFVSNDVAKICGHSPEAYEDYVADRDSMSPKELEAFLP